MPLAESERRFRTLFEQSPLSVQLLSADGRTIAVNKAYKKLWNLTDDFIENFIFKQYNMLNDPILEERGVAHLIRNAFNGESVDLPPLCYDPITFGHAQGRTRWVEAYLNPILDNDGNVSEVVLIHNDVTDKVESEAELKKAKEAAEQASRLKSSFLANMSHEIRTPLAAMIGYSQLLKSRDVNTDESQRFLDLIERNAMSLAKIIDDILDLSKVEADRLDVNKVAVSLKIIFEELASLFAVQFSEKPVVLEIKPIPLSLKKIKTDPLRLRQILINLVGNALKFTSRGTITVEVREVNSCVQIEVTDTGIGIPAELQGALFESFRQADNTYTRQFSGTGLGLALSRRLARALGGEVQLEKSAPGAGSKFSLTLPLEALGSGETHEAVSSASLNSKTSLLQGLKILVADDFDDVRQLVVRVLKLNGATVSEVTNGRDVLLEVPGGNYDAILMDIQMPILDGLQATRTLREKGFTKPIIALTAHALVEERNRCLEAGADVHFVKPINFPLLIETIVTLKKKNS